MLVMQRKKERRSDTSAFWSLSSGLVNNARYVLGLGKLDQKAGGARDFVTGVVSSQMHLTRESDTGYIIFHSERMIKVAI